MAKRGKNYIQVSKKKEYKVFSISEAVKKVKTMSYSKFDGTVELHFAVKLPKDKEARSIKGSVSLPYSQAKAVRIAAFTSPADENKAKEAGADLYGTDKIIKDVKAGKIEFDVAIATPEAMPIIAQLGRELGPKGLMPNPKTGTVTTDIAKTIAEYKKGKLTFGADTNAVIHMPVGKVTLENEKLEENIREAIKAISETVGNKMVNQVVRSLHLAPTMGPSVEFEYSE